MQATDPKKWLSITGAPRIADGRIFIGEAGSEFEERGQYNAHCASCHGNNSARVSSLFPDLRYAGALWTTDGFRAIVIDGVLQENGMVSFRKVLTTDDAEAIRAYVVHAANQAKNAPPGMQGGPPGAGASASPPAPAAGTPAMHH